MTDPRAVPRVGFPADLPGLTALRFPLAAGVVAFHLHLAWPYDDLAFTGLVERSRLGVDVFFILSGFVLTHVYQAEVAEGRFRYDQFLLARVARIFPLHLAVIAGMMGVVIGARLIGVDFAQEAYSLAGLAQTVLLVQAWSWSSTPVEWNGPSWSLSAEWLAYLAFPLFASTGLALRRRPLALLGLAVGMFLALDAVYQAAFGDLLTHAERRLGVLRIAPEFLYGVALYRLAERWRPTPAVAWAGAGAACCLMLLLLHLRADERLIVAAAGPLVLSLALVSSAGADQPFRLPSLRLAGEASFALYLVHMPVLVLWKRGMGIATERPTSEALGPWEAPVVAVLCVALAIGAHLLIERPARGWVRALGPRVFARPGAAAGFSAPRGDR